jgi:peptidoglycan hydrolase CwlO-like protein
MKILIACLGSFLLFAALPAHAQSPDAGSTPPSTAKPADPPANTPASTSPEKKKPKKVWTNDEIGSIKGSVSVVGDGNSPSAKNGDKQPTSSSGTEDARQKQIENYRNQIQQYQSDIEAIDKRIAQLKNFKGENTSPSGGINPTQGYNMVPLEDQVKQLEDKKKQLQAKIEDTENEARKNGIESGDLR